MKRVGMATRRRKDGCWLAVISGVFVMGLVGGWFVLSSMPLFAQDAQRERPARQRQREGSRRTPRVHDPSTIVKHNGVYWTFATGRGVSSLRSTDLVHWQRGPAALPEPPAWITDIVPDQRGHFWAPDVIEVDDRWLLYYSVSAFGKQTSAIGLATSPTLDPDDPEYAWTDQGIVIQTDDDSDYNAIDPGIIRDEDGRLWMVLGSFWSGIKLVELDPKTGKRIAPDSPIHALAHKEQIEAAAVYHHGGRYYLFLNWGWCCRGVRSTYNIRVGRSREITGPYLDRDGVDMLDGGGTLVLETDGEFIGPGHPGILQESGRFLLSYHYYDGNERGRSRLAIRPLEWDEEGWPRVVGEPFTRQPEESAGNGAQ